MIEKANNNERQKRRVLYVKPILSYDQIVEIIDERIDIIEKAAAEKENKIKKNNHHKK